MNYNRVLQLQDELSILRVEHIKLSATVSKRQFQYDNRMTNIGPDTFDCYLGCSLNEKVAILKNQCDKLKEVINMLVETDRMLGETYMEE